MLQSIGWSALINAFALPGALLGSLLVDPLGRKETYALGWGIVSVLGFVIGGAMIKLHSVFPLFVVLYGLFQSFLSVGPGNNNFLVSSESFPTPIRGHFLGFAAAVGKAGAAIGTTVMSRVYDSYDDQQKGQQVLFLIGSAISVVGTLVVWFGLPHVSMSQITLGAKLMMSSICLNSRPKMPASKRQCKLKVMLRMLKYRIRKCKSNAEAQGTILF
jgi:MFS family permease